MAGRLGIDIGDRFEGSIPGWRNRFLPQNPYKNGILVWRLSQETGGGAIRGQETYRVATRNKVVVGVYECEPNHLHAVVIDEAGGRSGVKSIRPDIGHYGNGEPYVERKTISKWIEAVKQLQREPKK
jgi:hypothetical protein